MIGAQLWNFVSEVLCEGTHAGCLVLLELDVRRELVASLEGSHCADWCGGVSGGGSLLKSCWSFVGEQDELCEVV